MQRKKHHSLKSALQRADQEEEELNRVREQMKMQIERDQAVSRQKEQKAAFDTALVSIQQRHDKFVEALRNDHALSMARQVAEHREAYGELEEKYQDVETALIAERAEYQASLATEQRAFDEKLAAIEADSIHAIEMVKKRSNSEWEDRFVTAGGEWKALENRLRAEIADISAKYDAELKRSDLLESQMKQELDLLVTKLDSAYQQKLEEDTRRLNNELKAAQSEADAAICERDELKEEVDRLAQEIGTSSADKMKRISAVQEAFESLTAAHNDMTQMEESHKAEIKELKARFAMQEQKYKSDIDELSFSHTQDLDHVYLQLQRILTEKMNEIAYLKNELAIERQGLSDIVQSSLSRKMEVGEEVAEETPEPESGTISED